MKGESAADVADRMRAIAAGTSNPADAKAILHYADWLEREAALEQPDDLREDRSRGDRAAPEPPGSRPSLLNEQDHGPASDRRLD